MNKLSFKKEQEDRGNATIAPELAGVFDNNNHVRSVDMVIVVRQPPAN
jgi:hypothetical protein